MLAMPTYVARYYYFIRRIAKIEITQVLDQNVNYQTTRQAVMPYSNRVAKKYTRNKLVGTSFKASYFIQG